MNKDDKFQVGIKSKINEEKMMKKVKCELCNKIMLEADGCSYTKIKYNGKIYDRIRVGEEFDLMSGAMSDGERCSDCGAKVGEVHHYRCAKENSPVDHTQMIDYELVDEFLM